MTASTRPGIPKEDRQEMNPLTNAVLGVVFLLAGAVATVLMYRLRGGPRKTARNGSPVARPQT